MPATPVTRPLRSAVAGSEPRPELLSAMGALGLMGALLLTRAG